MLEVWASERAAATLEWLEEGPRARVKRERELTEAAGSPDHQGVVAWCEPYPYADAWELAATDRPLLCCLDQVTDPRNLGAVIRSAAGAGATGVVLPAHGATVVTPAVCRSSAGAVEHLPVAVVPNLARYLGEVKGDRLWAYAAAADGETPHVGARSPDGVALVFGAEGKGVRPLVRRTCDGTVAIPLAPGVESLNVSVAAAVALFEARRQRRYRPRPEVEVVADVTLYLFDGSNLFHAGGFVAPRQAGRRARELRGRSRRARGRGLRRSGRGARGRSPQRFASPSTPTRSSSGSLPTHRLRARACCSSRRTPRSGARAARRCRKRGSAGFLPELGEVSRIERRRRAARGRSRRRGDASARSSASRRAQGLDHGVSARPAPGERRGSR